MTTIGEQCDPDGGGGVYLLAIFIQVKLFGQLPSTCVKAVLGEALLSLC